MVDESSATLEGLFAPWRHANGALLGGKVFSPSCTLPHERTLWISWHVPYHDPDAARACFECVQLLSLVAQVDDTIYWRLLQEVYRDLEMTAAQYPQCPSWPLGLDVQLLPGANFDLLRDCFECVDSAHAASPCEQNNAFLEARRVLQSHVDARAAHDAIPLRASIWRGQNGDGGLIETLKHVRDLACDFPATDERLRAVRLTDCFVELPSAPSITEMLGLVIKIMQCGVSISWIALSPSEDQEPVEAVTVAPATHLLLFPRVVDGGVASLAIHTDIEQSILIELSSALTHTRSVQVLLDTVIEDSQADTTRSSWRWLALVLFGSQAAHSIARLEVDLTNLTAEHVSLIESVIQSQDPSPATVNTEQPHGKAEPHQAAYTTPGTEVRSAQPVSHGDFWIQEALGTVTLVDESDADSPWLRVLMPAIGQCWLLRQDPLCEEAGHRNVGYRVDHLVLSGITEESATPALAFVKMIARGTKTLEMRDTEDDSPGLPTWQAQCITACPELRELIVDTHHMETMDAILRMVDKSPGSCPLDTLRLERILSADDFDVLHRLLEALGDQHQPIAAQLRHLTISGSEETRYLEQAMGMWSYVVNMLVSVLRQNRQLVSCHVQLPRGNRKLIRNWREFASLDGEILALRAGPLPLPCKLAFLSVAASKSDGRFANDVLALIFEFAAECARRECLLV